MPKSTNFQSTYCWVGKPENVLNSSTDLVIAYELKLQWIHWQGLKCWLRQGLGWAQQATAKLGIIWSSPSWQNLKMLWAALPMLSSFAVKLMNTANTLARLKKCSCTQHLGWAWQAMSKSSGQPTMLAKLNILWTARLMLSSLLMN